jgi:hypothetical protein
MVTMSAMAAPMAAPKVKTEAVSHWMIFMTIFATASEIRSMIIFRTAATSWPAPATAPEIPAQAFDSVSSPVEWLAAAVR